MLTTSNVTVKLDGMKLCASIFFLFFYLFFCKNATKQSHIKSKMQQKLAHEVTQLMCTVIFSWILIKKKGPQMKLCV